MLTSHRGQPSPLGSSLHDQGVNFAVYAPGAKEVQLCLFDQSGHSEIAKITMYRHEGGLWSVFVSPLRAGALYGFRAAGRYAPEKGLLFNHHKLLLDPYCKDFHGEFTWSERHFCHLPVGTLNPSDNAVDMPKSCVTDIEPYEGARPDIPWSKTLVYECHVRGATKQCEFVPKPLRGKFLGLSHSNFIAHLASLGVTTIELLPCHAFISEQFLTTKGLKNYWGYNSLSFFVPHKEFLVDGNISEFQQMVRELHRTGIEVILDVVYNHTAEGGLDGPTLSLKGLNNTGYYRMVGEQAQYINDTGCGNTLNIDDPYTLKLVMDSLRYWVEFMGVDGFRFDLATILARTEHGFSSQHSFLQAMAQDPVLSKVKLIAEPWDVGPGGYQLGGFPSPWREWNDKYRDTVRRFWRGDAGTLSELAKRVHGSHELFEHNQRGPLNSVNFITSHDGFTLADWVSYEQKHNFANGEDNRDGHSENLSFNCGVEGQTDHQHILALRHQIQKSALITLMMSKGVPMLAAGTEIAHSQQGNNNAYCQDNQINWLSWPQSISERCSQNRSAKGSWGSDEASTLCALIARLQEIRCQYAIFHHPFFIHTQDERFNISWFNKDARPMSEDDWHDSHNKTLIYMLTDTLRKQSLLVILHAGSDDVAVKLPVIAVGVWKLTLSSAPPTETIEQGHQTQSLSAHSAWVYQSHNEDLKND
ncbi:glycogen debranching protein GlgX [Pseudoalteromonas viridis]|uniref:Glycogen debranching protein GlgX n=1 Tax=Pseudoalteromonas viridis TaxID=339617 RepID=A0ABX7VH62_9GAMM|nr:glycogen debranching protein GlgX [Pseudoalteromonas viridis]QTL38074.1 glycogen debranching protein GlgX [Pseudoalteromonas viridis]